MLIIMTCLWLNFAFMLLFLDIDGVMVPAKSWETPALLVDGFPAFSSRAIAALQRLISEGASLFYKIAFDSA